MRFDRARLHLEGYLRVAHESAADFLPDNKSTNSNHMQMTSNHCSNYPCFEQALTANDYRHGKDDLCRTKVFQCKAPSIVLKGTDSNCRLCVSSM